MSKDSAESFRLKIAEYAFRKRAEDLGLLSIALQVMASNLQEDELKQGVKVYRQFANEYDMSVMEMNVLEHTFACLDITERGDFMLNPESFIPNYQVLRQFGKVMERYTEDELIAMNEEISYSEEEYKMVMRRADTEDKYSPNELLVIGVLPERARSIKKVLTSILGSAASRSTTGVSTPKMKTVYFKGEFRIALDGAVEETIMNPGMPEVFINKFKIPGTQEMLTRSYLMAQASLPKKRTRGLLKK